MLKLDSFSLNVFGKNVGVVHLLNDGLDYDHNLTVFRYNGKGEFQLLQYSEKFTKKDVEKLDTVVFCYLNSISNSKELNVDDQIEMALLEKYNEDNFYNYFSSNSTLYVNTIPKTTFYKLQQLAKSFLKDIQIEAINLIGVSFLHQTFDNEDIKIDYSSALNEMNIVLSNERHNMFTLNALGLLASNLYFSGFTANFDYSSDINILKGFAKRFMIKVLPVVFVLLILNYFYFNYLNKQLFEIQQKQTFVSDLLGERQVKINNEINQIKLYNELIYPSQLNRPYLLNELIEAHVTGVIYDEISLDLAKNKYGNIELKFTLLDDKALSKWIEKLKNIDKVDYVEVHELDQGFKGKKKGILRLKYDEVN